MLEDVKRDLGATFNTEEYDVLKRLIDEVTRDALSISNREDTEENRNLLIAKLNNVLKNYIYREVAKEVAHLVIVERVLHSLNRLTT